MHPITRRTALRRMGYLGGALSLPSAMPLAGFRGPREKLGVALVGLGNYATRQLRPALRHARYCALRGIVTGTPAKERQWRAEYGVLPEHTYNDDTFDRIADDEAIDIVYVVLPNFLHAEHTIRTLEARFVT